MMAADSIRRDNRNLNSLSFAWYIPGDPNEMDDPTGGDPQPPAVISASPGEACGFFGY